MIVLGVLLLQLLNIRLLLAICLTNCSTINIEYPFGTNINCDALQGFELTCNQSYQPPKLFLANSSVEVLNISYLNSTALVRSKVVSTNQSNYSESWSLLPPNGPCTMSTTKNKFVAAGCGTFAQLSSLDQQPQQVISACVSVCVSEASTPTDGSCTGIGCCKSSIPISNNSFKFRLTSINQMSPSANKAFIVEETWLNTNAQAAVGWYTNLTDDQSVAVPVLLDWKINASSCSIAQGMSNYQCKSQNSYCVDYNVNGTGYQCKCSDGYDGNPYRKDGCQDIDECKQKDIYPCYGVCRNTLGSYNCFCEDGKNCPDPKKEECISSDGQDFTPLSSFLIGVATTVGISLLILAMPVLFYKRKKIKEKGLKKKHFLQNRGLLLRCNEDVAGRMRIFSIEELEMATNKFDKTRLLGRGGHGEVYKGILSDKRVVAIKKSLIAVKSEINQFINEVAILSQINHRNVVKLFGCCLETEVPLLVYEFISNGTLSEHLHVESNCCLSWDDRLRIASETARALAYLHTAAPVSVFHRDIKPVNIMLDDTLTAKVSDFGASRSVLIDQTRITTAVQGTYGYLDPEYFYTSRLTNKSDVYSFGVILVELLTRETPHEFSRSEEAGTLVSYFTSLQRDNRLFEILDPKIVHQGPKAELEGVAQLAEMCLRLKGEERPTMKEVDMRLEELRALQKRHAHPWTEESSAEQQKLLQVEGVITTRQFSFEQELKNSSSFPR